MKEPDGKGKLMVWLAKEVEKDQFQEICDNCDVKLLDFNTEKCIIGFEEEKAKAVIEKLYGWPEFILKVTRLISIH